MGLLSSLFSSKQVNDQFLKVDMHSHLIPGIDDGVETVEDSLEVIQQLMKLGYQKAITTPHIMGDFFKNTPENIHEGLDKVRLALKANNIDFQLEAAAEYYLDEWFLQKLDADQPLLTFGDNYLLVETSYMNRPNNLNDYLFRINAKGYKLILAHPERYLYMYDNYSGYKELYDRGVYFQVNLNSLTGYYSKGAKQIVEKLIADNMVDFLGTDCHGKRHLEPLIKSFETKAFGSIDPSRILNNSLL